jgi:hypothetical protein
VSTIGPVQRRVLKYVRDHPGCTMGEVARFYDNPRKGVRYVWALNAQRRLVDIVGSCPHKITITDAGRWEVLPAGISPRRGPVGPRQAEVLRYVIDHPGCTAAETARGVGWSKRFVYDLMWSLRGRGLLTVDDRTRPYRMQSTEDGGQTMRAILHRQANPDCENECCGRKTRRRRQQRMRQLIDRAEYLPPGYAEREALIDELGPLVAKQITRFTRNAS